ncbi:MAG: YhcH/YjgK/YiaL family protein [Clostridia bacterium]|nr:YhcH/YjgK/YiaL family protein [Clostridia bacterium]
MIHANLSYNDFYKNIDDKIALCLEKSKTLDANTPCGKYILNDDVYVNVIEYSPKPIEEALAETHAKYADIQLILSGEEYIGYAKTSLLSPKSRYDEENDIRFWQGDTALLPMQQGDWALFMPGEAHSPSLDKCGGKVKKAIFKIRYAND